MTQPQRQWKPRMRGFFHAFHHFELIQEKPYALAG